ncbi:MAG: S4 domain-containing protein, partial [Clostridia bacterium]
IVDLLIELGFSSSKGGARRLIQGRGIKINGEVVSDAAILLGNTPQLILSRGKNKFIKVIFG